MKKMLLAALAALGGVMAVAFGTVSAQAALIDIGVKAVGGTPANPHSSTAFHLISTTGTSGVTALSAIPEPPPWAMALLGFVCLGYAAFRRVGGRRQSSLRVHPDG